jgi:hypothetical protein
MTPVGPRAPLATYRLQLGSQLTFDDAAGLVPYLAALGISDCYISPFFENERGELSRLRRLRSQFHPWRARR